MCGMKCLSQICLVSVAMLSAVEARRMSFLRWGWMMNPYQAVITHINIHRFNVIRIAFILNKIAHWILSNSFYSLFIIRVPSVTRPAPDVLQVATRTTCRVCQDTHTGCFSRYGNLFNFTLRDKREKTKKNQPNLPKRNNVLSSSLLEYIRSCLVLLGPALFCRRRTTRQNSTIDAHGAPRAMLTTPKSLRWSTFER